ncbi:maltotransferase domain-containing protein, partial [Streptomyces mexicanus]|uniref:maltotransferase domain-containing protein n=2 Tax=Streptomyces mexicanus TaxID=178566 RepID=UPI0036A50ED0
MPATHHSAAPPSTSTSTRASSSTSTRTGTSTTPGASGTRPHDPGPPAASAPAEGSDAGETTAVGRIPVLDVRPVVQHGRRPAKAVTGESFQVTATVFREGHDAVAANVVLTDP